MAQNLHLEDEQEELLRFILDTTIERWTDEEEGQLEAVAADPSFKSFEELTEATGYIHELLERLKALRHLMDLEEVI
jgi:hypothetical protein